MDSSALLEDLKYAVRDERSILSRLAALGVLLVTDQIRDEVMRKIPKVAAQAEEADRMSELWKSNYEPHLRVMLVPPLTDDRLKGLLERDSTDAPLAAVVLERRTRVLLTSDWRVPSGRCPPYGYVIRSRGPRLGR